MSRKRPSVGSVVHYVEPGTVEDDRPCRAAMVTGVAENGAVSVEVFGLPERRLAHGVRQLDDDQARILIPEHTWHWPEQVGVTRGSVG